MTAMAYVTRTEVRKVAKLAHLLISDGWCKGALATDRFGRPATTRCADASQWSLVGALKAACMRLHGRDWAPVMRAARNALAPVCGRDLTEWNDSPGRWKGEVLDVLEGL